ncbi:MAG: TetR/AcrR family transcriptional regulator [Desulfobacterales bacterium]|jgi:AcrR family transcriptional regulator|nr:TetR/AcrR family transcriptional regulator [Desulfobacteraceae bacterium]MDY0311689.1 TetR/AcrR family transcriptional regulator [Desulfobacterales bacterium]
MPTATASKRDIETQVKNPELVARRRRQIVDAAVPLFIEKGFHKTTTRQIAAATGFSIGLLYEYVRSKEDVLYLVCEAIHQEVERCVNDALQRHERGRDALAAMIHEYFTVCHRMNDHILLIYQETQSLPPHWRKRVLENEVRLTGLFVNALARLIAHGDLPKLTEESIELVAHNITVLGHMWTFRRWFLARHYSIEDYITLQTGFILGLLGG